MRSGEGSDSLPTWTPRDSHTLTQARTRTHTCTHTHAHTHTHFPLPQFTGDWLDLERWYSDPKKRERSYAVKISKYLRARAAGVAR